ncbi:hypothetical protein SLEP1_g16632 [Rubroshorea leprosula]|uniref:Uncharacterized protein n=1 Tax=Rubroshorea leprosula TaxID=152421 RepID=A0AAV5IRG9_9ROSI|nr:hypothetical protein SLEP1_g16632 [Rubroshorea leprosula]
MPLDYGSMDSKSSPSPSNSENTVEGVRGDEVIEVGEEEVVGVGGNEVVGVGGGSIPITVVEVEGRGKREYDVNVEIVEEVQQYRSELRTRDSLGHLVENYEISSRVLVRLAGVKERACSAPRDHWMPIYSHYLLAGLRFPIPELLVGLLLDYKIGLTQLVPNAMRGGSRRDKGWYYFTPRVANRESRSLFTAAEMDQFLNTAGGAAIPKKPRKKSKTSTKQVDEGRARKEVVPTISAEVEEEVPQLKRKGWEERRALQKKQRVVEEETGNEVPVFVPQPSPVELNPELRQLEEGAKVRAPGKGKGPVPPLGPQSNLFEAKNITGARWFINNTFPEVDQCNAQEEALRYGGASVVKHVLESASWVNGLAQEFRESLKDHALLQRQRDQLQKEKEELEKKNKELQESLNEAQEMKLMTEAFKELKGNMRKLVHNGMKEHISNFISSSSFDSIQDGGVEEDGESMSADFRPQIKLRWEDDADGLAVFPPQFDFEFVAVEEERAEVEEDEMEGGGRDGGRNKQQPTQPPPPAEQELVEPPLRAEK